MGELTGQVAVVTGGGRGIGRAIARTFAEAGAAVMVSSRTAEELAETVAQIEEAGGRAVAFPANVRERSEVEAMLAEAERQLGPVSILVNNAGGGTTGTGPFETLDPGAIFRTIELNLLTALLCTRLALPGMLERGAGRIINVASGAGIVGIPYLNAYSVAKAGLIRFSENLAIELRGRGVSVFAITPGMVRTKPMEGIWQLRKQIGTDELPANAPQWFNQMQGPPHEVAPLDEAWQPPERAGALCRFLASGKADRLSGHFFSAYYDEQEIVDHADEVEREMLYTLRLPTLHGVERPTTAEDVAAAARSD